MTPNEELIIGGTSDRPSGSFVNKNEGDRKQVWQGRPHGNRYEGKQYGGMNTVEFINSKPSTSQATDDNNSRTNTDHNGKKKHPCTANDLVFVNKHNLTNNVSILLPDLRDDLLQDCLLYTSLVFRKQRRNIIVILLLCVLIMYLQDIVIYLTNNIINLSLIHI